MNGAFSPAPTFVTKSFSATYSLAAEASTELTLTTTSPLTGTYTPIGIQSYSTGDNNVYVRRIANVSQTGCKINIRNASGTASNNKTASVDITFVRTS